MERGGKLHLKRFTVLVAIHRRTQRADRQASFGKIDLGQQPYHVELPNCAAPIIIGPSHAGFSRHVALRRALGALEALGIGRLDAGEFGLDIG